MDFTPFFEAHNPTPWRILGRELKPFSLGHRILLRRLGSPFMVSAKGDTRISIDDVVLAVFVCSQTYEHCVELMNSEQWHTELADWGREVYRGRGLLAWFRKPKEINWKAKVTMFTEYLKESISCPDFQYDAATSKDVHCPEEQIIKVTLRSKMGMTESEVLNRSWALCQWDFLTLKAMDGQIEFIDLKQYEAAQKKANEYFERLNKDAIIQAKGKN